MARFWSRIWKLKVPGKILLFLWKACTDCLPTKVNLMKRRIMDDSHCELCGRLPEDTKHALWSCEAVRRVWCVDFNWVTEGMTNYGSFLDLVKQCLTKPGAGVEGTSIRRRKQKESVPRLASYPLPGKGRWDRSATFAQNEKVWGVSAQMG
nr:hypothetical protein CFP56_23122 [Quercus suber]